MELNPKRGLLYFLIIMISIVASDYYYDPPAPVPEINNFITTSYGEALHTIIDHSPYSVEPMELLNGSLNYLLMSLDPHSYYMTPAMFEQNIEEYRGDYSGIGISFDVINGRITVISASEGGPAEKVGIIPGDIIVEINGANAIGMQRTRVPRLLRGEPGTKVTVGVSRRGVKERLYFTLTRATISIESVENVCMLTNGVGYLRINRFAKRTSEEVEAAIVTLLKKGMKKLVIDLRDNPGGYLYIAVMTGSRFLPEEMLITYVKSRNAKERDEKKIRVLEGNAVGYEYERYYSRQKQSKWMMPLIVLIDQTSASAAEIFAGAIQDNDRGLIIGQTSFGKGLVQQPFMLSDGSVLWLTIGKYYTPSGRLIQRNYKGLSLREYLMNSGINNNLDESPPKEETNTENKRTYFTKNGREVYGGGGIKPDITIHNAQNWNRFALMLMNRRLLFEFATEYKSQHPELINNSPRYISRFDFSDRDMENLARFIKSSGVNFSNSQFNSARKDLKFFLKMELARILWGSTESFIVRTARDPFIKTALNSFEIAENLLKKPNILQIKQQE